MPQGLMRWGSAVEARLCEPGSRHQDRQEYSGKA